MERENKHVVLVGYGGHSLVLYDMLNLNSYKIEGYFDTKKHLTNPLGLDYLGDDDFLRKYILANPGILVVIAIGDNKIREKISNRLLEVIDQFRIPSIIHKTSLISPTTKIDFGVHVMPNVIINAFSEIHFGVICNSGSIIEHECVIGKFTHLAPGAVLTGNCKIGERCLIGANAVIRPAIKICDDVIIGSGSVVISDIKQAGIYAGNPAKLIRV